MIVDHLFSFLAHSAPAIAVVLYVSGILVLLHSMRVQDQHTRKQSETIHQLREHLGQSVKAQVEMHDHVNLLHERYTELLSRQQRVENRPADSRRINTAMRMLKRGTADAQTLQDLGLSNGEAKLLLRLHSAPGPAATAPSPQHHVSPGVTSQSASTHITVTKRGSPKVARAGDHTRKHPVAAQGRALAQLLEA